MKDLASVLNQECVHVKVWEDLDEGGFIAECIDIPGCMSQGETRNEALANVMDAISACLDTIAEDAGLDIPAEEPEVLEFPLSQFFHAAH